MTASFLQFELSSIKQSTADYKIPPVCGLFTDERL